MRTIRSMIPQNINQFKSIRSSIMFSFTVVVLLALVIFSQFSLIYTQDALVENSEEYTLQMVEQINSEIDSYISYMENISQMVSKNGFVERYFFADDQESADIYPQLLEQFDIVLEIRPDIYNIAAAASNGRYAINHGKSRLKNYEELQEMTWYQDTIRAKGESVLTPTHVQNAVIGDYQWVVTLSKALKNPLTGKYEGVFFIDLNYSIINSLCEKVSLGNKGYLFVINDNKDIVYHPKQQLVYSGMKKEYIDEVLAQKQGNFVTSEGKDSRLYTACRSEKTGWTVVGVSYMREFMKGWEQTRIVYILGAFVLLLLSMLLAMLLSRQVTRPIRQLKDAMKKVEKGDFTQVALKIKGINEVASLGKAFYIMTEKIQELMEENIQKQKEKRKSELNTLQAQINPHFLYNTLDSIIWMAESRKIPEVIQMTSTLAKLLRQSISNDAEIVPIKKEIEYTESYLTIQKMRYRDQLEFEIDIEERIMNVEIVKLVIQPLVENSIYHGIKNIKRKGKIVITGGFVGKDVVISIRDNGNGMTKECLAHILENKHSSSKSKHVGAFNVHNRLQLYYGDNYGLIYESSLGAGTTVFIKVPGNRGM